MITGGPEDSFDYLSDDFQEIASKLQSQICEQPSDNREEKVCCRKKNEPVKNFSNCNLTSEPSQNSSSKSTVVPELVSTPHEEATHGWLD